MSRAGAAAPARALRRALALLALAGAVIVATEFIIVGLLPVLARDLDASLAETGHLVGVFAVSAALLGPLCTLALAGRKPRPVLVAALLCFAAGNVAAIAVPSYATLMAVRIVQGAALPVFFSFATATVIALAPPERRGRALALANTGFVIGLVVAMPAGVALADGGAWVPSFVALAALALAATALVVLWFPEDEVQAVPALAQIGLLARPLFASHLLLSVAVFAAMFAAYTYLAAWLAEAVGLGNAALAVALAGFGAVGLVGNMLAARLADRALLGITMAVLALLALAVLGATHLAANPAWLVPLLALWGAAHTAGVALCQVRVTLAGGDAPAFAMAMNISSANFGIAIGALVGGGAVDRWGLDALGWTTAALALVAGAAAAATAWLGRASARSASSRLPARRSRKARRQPARTNGAAAQADRSRRGSSSAGHPSEGVAASAAVQAIAQRDPPSDLAW